MFSRNYFWLRVVAFFLIVALSTIVSLFFAFFFGASDIQVFFIGVITSAILGAWNVVEPKAVEQELEKIRHLLKIKDL